jgi:transposase
VIIIGLDPHPASHAVAALDENRTVLGHIAVANDAQGLRELQQWAASFPERCWAIEGANNPFIAPFVAELVSQGERVVPIHPNLTSQYRSRRGKKKDDKIDAENVARALWANPALPAYVPSREQREFQLLSRTRARLAKQLQANRAALANLPPQSATHASLARVVGLLRKELAALDKELARQIKVHLPTLLEVSGVGPCVAGVVAAEVGNMRRFPSEDAFASYCGAAPVSKESGQYKRAQVNPGGNRRLNWAVHIMALSRLKNDPRSKAFVARKQREGKSKREVLRILKTYLARELYRFLKQQTASPQLTQAA